MSAEAERTVYSTTPGYDPSNGMAGVPQTVNPEIKTILVVGLGMVGIGEYSFGTTDSCYLSCTHIAFIEKMLNLDEIKRYRLVTCGEGRLTHEFLSVRYEVSAHTSYHRGTPGL